MGQGVFELIERPLRSLSPLVHRTPKYVGPCAFEHTGAFCHTWTLSMLYSVKQLTEGLCCITMWQTSGFTSAFSPGEQKKLSRLTLNSLFKIIIDNASLFLSLRPFASRLI
jgi:hypothetical protein